MIDTHNHILPGVDDGAATIEEALAMARRAVVDGIDTIAVSPHYEHGTRTNPIEEIRQRVAALQAVLEENQIPLRLLPGAEVPVMPELLDMLADRTVPTIGDNGRWVLLEMPFDRFPLRFRDMVFRLQTAGYDPVLAHPERNVRIQSDIAVLDDLVPGDTPLQITSHSLTGGFGSSAKRCAEKLLISGRPVLLASDAHSARGRGPVLREAVTIASNLMGDEGARQLVDDLPRAILRGDAVWSPPVAPQKRRGVLTAVWSKVFG
ncbi:MAG: tyrosine-protein phosphatase [Armatimonadota bacterium]